MHDQPAPELTIAVGSASPKAKIPPKPSWLATSKTIWLVGLPLFLVLLVIFNTLWSPVQTRQLKEFEPLSGTAPAEIAYRLTFDHRQPQKLILKLAAAEPVTLTLLQNGQTRLTTQLVPPVAEMGLVEVGLTNLVDDRLVPLIIRLNFGAGNWQLAYHNENVYQNGAFEPAGATPTGGDLVFVVDYGSRPLLRLERFFEGQRRWGGLAGLAVLTVLLALGLAGWALFRFGRDPAGFTNRILYQRGGYWRFAGFCGLLTFSLALAFMLINPPLQGPDEQGHVVRSIALGRGVNPESLATATENLMGEARLVDNFAWLSYDDKILNELPANNQAHQAPLYYGVAGTLVKFSTLLTDSFAAQSYFVRLASIFFLLGTLSAALTLGWLLRLVSPWLALALPLTVALWPQALFLGSVSNNDNAAACFAAWACLGMLLLFRAENWRGWLTGLAVVLVALVLADFSKRTVATSWGGFGLGLWVLVLFRATKTWKLIWLGLTALLLTGLASLFLTLTTDIAARGWYVAPLSSTQHANRLLYGQAAGGKYVLPIVPSQPVEQVVDMFYRPEVKRVYFRGQLKAATAPTRVKVELIGVRQTLAEINLEFSNTDWQAVSFEATIPPQVANSRTEPFLQLRFSLPEAAGQLVLADELYLYSNEPRGPNLLINSSLEEGNLTLLEPYRSDRNSLVYYYSGVVLDILSNGRGLVFDQAVFQNLTFFFLTIWGAFGWGQIFLSFFWYAVAALVTTSALVGLLLLPRRHTLAGWQKAFGWYCGLAAGSTLGIHILVKFWGWLYTGAQDFVAGRFMFIVLLPLLILLLSGLRGLSRKHSSLWLGLWAWTTFLFIFTLAALLGHIFLQYY